MTINKSRLESFSDGVIAVSLTLMLYQIQLPAEFNWDGVRAEARQFFGYVLSFIYVGIYWNNHHHLFQMVRGINGKIMWANLNLLFWLTMIPITTTWTGKSEFSEVPTALYAFVLFMCAISYWILQRLIIASEGKGSSLARAIGKDLKGRVSLVVYALAIMVSFYSTIAATFILIAMAAFWFFPDSRIERYLLGQEGKDS
ncbi:Potassium channel [Cupriavidus yeoncheonensis]|uniref:Potassium channel n=1 Tax=Cupriavidus yeoncheonensis TaxID=1462994 RepID=A0A916IS28_9BURK|nr:TMEM175 family protein [Cupriavidus yeoncheonensis]CAG2137034.1 Potassium channel [Cupriavidus yeoncheonensis]